ncbi:MAG: cellulase family glycosylhydrolase [Clostridia bacterium]|nr:cellulase family glycosylhydrolase [Clostridia bacterium]
MDKIRTQGKVLLDSQGRERIFYGINVCDKGSFIEETGNRCYNYKCDDDMLKAFRKQGYNLIRLGITWDAVEPQRGKYNDVYIAAVKGMLDKCREYGMYAYIDMHQDLYSGWGNGPGDGAPDWACHTDGIKYKMPKLVWAESYFYGKATHRAFDNFWDNKYGVQDDFVRMWAYLASKLDGHPALFGYDLLNEPFLGSDGGRVFKTLIKNLVKTSVGDKRISMKQLAADALTKGDIIHVLDQYNGEVFNDIVNTAAPIVNSFDLCRYMPFMDKTASAIRKVSPDPIIFMENCYYSNLGIEFAGRPVLINGEKAENQLFAPHAYDLMVDTPAYKHASNDRVKSIFDRRKKEQDENLDMPVIVGEWGGYSEGTEWLPHIEFLLELFDKNKWSSTYWAYFDGLLGSPMWETLKKPYPRAVTGKIDSYYFDRDGNTFTLVYTQDKEFDAPTEIFAHKEIAEVITDGEYEIEQLDDEAYIIKISTGIGRHNVRIVFKGEGFSYASNS